MPFEEQLKRTFDAALAELVEAARQDRDRAAAEARTSAAAEAEERLGAAVPPPAADAEERLGAAVAAAEVQARQEGVAEGRAQGWEDGHEQGRFEGRQEAEQEAQAAIATAVEAARTQPSPDDSRATEQLLDAVRAIDAARSLGDVLDTLVDRVARDGARAGVWIVRGGQLRPWRFAGVHVPTDIALADSGVVADAIAARACVTSETIPAFAGASDGHCAAMPIELAGEVVAALYADRIDVAGPGGDQPPAASHQPPATSNQQPATSREHRGASRLEILARHAARTLEAITAIKAARALTGSRDVSASGTSSGAAGDGAAQSPASDGDDDAAARRYAKLLVSEIKLYHEPAVVAGRRDRDLATRLGGEIARARVLYDERVPAAVRQRADYFHDELVRTLANGDASLLQLT